MIITIDGPAAAGKGTLAQKLADKYNLAYFDTGMVYRAVGIDLISHGLTPDDVSAAEQSAKEMSFAKMIELSKNPDFRSSLGGQAASKVSALPKVREALLKMQQDFAYTPLTEEIPEPLFVLMPTSNFLSPHLWKSELCAAIKNICKKACLPFMKMFWLKPKNATRETLPEPRHL